ncbi:MAG TPA: M14 metallopeptidase family protein, partial [Pyrinomonadaceae bacterium]|nr:M14 metallopeptidase family protein [Pyrinomonadaceae bacterium]
MRKSFRSHPFCLRSALCLFAAAFLLLSAAAAPAARSQQRPRPRPAAGVETVRPAPPSPRSVLGFTPGDDRKVADWTEITNYFERLDRASDRVRVERVGETTLGRPLVAAFISAPENIRELAKYKDIQRRLADPRLVASEAERDRLVREGRTVVAISCSIHSTEVVGSQMSMQLAYELAAAGDDETRAMLRSTILILIPSANPDGNDIVADWYRKSLGQPWEGSEPPELYHHYAGHDNNRDWFMLNLEETRSLTRLFWKEWFPQIVYDVHQQGSTGSRFFIPPFYDPPNPHIAPLLLREVGLVGHRVAADLQAAGFRGVITNAMYDTWWHGGFRTAPYFHNSIGILSEAASARLMTPIRVRPEELERARSRGMPNGALTPMTNFPDPWPGGQWRPRDIRDMELVAARAVLSYASEGRERILRNFYELGRRAIDWPPADSKEPIAYVIPAGQGRDENLSKMIGALVEQGVEVQRMDTELHLSHTSRDARDAHETPSGSYLVPLAQPYRTNVQALFERQ